MMNDPIDRTSENPFDMQSYSIIRVQALIRRFLARSRQLKEIYKRFEKIYDPKRKRFYYYDKVKDKSSWVKPPFLMKLDLPEVAATYTAEQAAVKIQGLVRKAMSLHRMRILYQSNLTTIADEKTGKRLYYNPKSGRTSEKLPRFMKGRLDYRKKKVMKNVMIIEII